MGQSLTTNLGYATLALGLVVLATGEAQAGPGRRTEIGVRRSGTPILTRQAPNYAACRLQCVTTVVQGQACEAYAFNTTNGSCELFITEPLAVADPSFVSGLMTPDSSIHVAYANLATSRDYRTRVPNFVVELALAGEAPDVLLLTELHHYALGTAYGRIEPYEMLHLIHDELARVFGIQYRIAYATGVEMEIGKERLSGWAHQGEALLYNPERMINLTANDVTVIAPTISLPHVVRGIGSPAVNDERTLDYNERGTHLRASVPVCNSKHESFARAFLDGPEMEMRNPGAGPFYTYCVGPIGPAWNFQYDPQTGRWRRIGAFNRMALKTDPDHALEFYNVHLTQNERTGDGVNVVEETLRLVRQFVGHPKGPSRPPLHTAPIFANDINVSFNDSGFQLLLRELDDWQALEWGPGLAAVQAPNLPSDYVDTMGVLQANLDPNRGPVYRDQSVLYPSVMVNSAWMPQGVSDPSIAPKGADLRYYTGPGLIFTDHTSQRFTLKTVEEQDVIPGFIQEWLRGVDLYDRGFVTTTFVRECAASDQCRAWRCEDLGACD